MFTHKLASESQADEDELLLFADKAPTLVRVRIQQRPDLLRKLVKMDRRSLDAIESSIDSLQ
jgi:hypothetical protein